MILQYIWRVPYNCNQSACPNQARKFYVNELTLMNILAINSKLNYTLLTRIRFVVQTYVTSFVISLGTHFP